MAPACESCSISQGLKNSPASKIRQQESRRRRRSQGNAFFFTKRPTAYFLLRPQSYTKISLLLTSKQSKPSKVKTEMYFNGFRYFFSPLIRDVSRLSFLIFYTDNCNTVVSVYRKWKSSKTIWEAFVFSVVSTVSIFNVVYISQCWVTVTDTDNCLQHWEMSIHLHAKLYCIRDGTFRYNL